MQCINYSCLKLKICFSVEYFFYQRGIIFAMCYARTCCKSPKIFKWLNFVGETPIGGVFACCYENGLQEKWITPKQCKISL